MSRLIDADALRLEIDTRYPFDKYTQSKHDAFDVAKSVLLLIIGQQPTIEERKKGRWIHLGGDEWCCDKCGFVITTEGSWEHPHDIGAKYCQNCGAKMGE